MPYPPRVAISVPQRDVSPPAPSDVAEAIKRPEAEGGAPDNIILGQKSPNMGVVAVVAVVSHDEILAGRHRVGPPLIIGGFGDVAFGEGAAIEVHPTAADGHFLSGPADDPFDEGVVFSEALIPELGRGDKDDDISEFGGMEAVGDFFDHEAIADLQGGKHRIRGDVAGFGDENAEQQGQAQGDGEKRDIFAPFYPGVRPGVFFGDRLLPFIFLGFHPGLLGPQ
jgi:hypothetical protein